MKQLQLLIPIVLLVAPAAFAQVTTTIFDEAFASGQRTSSVITSTSAQWFSSAGSTNVTYTADTSIRQLGAGRHLVAYFTADGSPVNIGVNETLTLTYTITFDRATPLNAADTNFRVGLFDSTPGVRVSADAHGGTSASSTFDNYTGYTSALNLGAASGAFTLRERSPLTNAALFSTSSLSSTTHSGPFQPNTPYTGVFSFTRTADDHLTMTHTITGAGLSNYTMSFTDDTVSTFAFDMMSFSILSSTADSFTITQAKLQYTAIPEPSTYAALAGLGALGLVLWRRRRTAA